MGRRYNLLFPHIVPHLLKALPVQFVNWRR